MPPGDIYSSFCLYRMGDAAADGISDHEAKGGRVSPLTPLWGLRFRSFYLHDGRATTPPATTRSAPPGGQATHAVAAYRKRYREQRAPRCCFLKTL